MALAVSSLVETDCGLATGASLTGLTVIETVAGDEFDRAVVDFEREAVRAVVVRRRCVGQVGGRPGKRAMSRDWQPQRKSMDRSPDRSRSG